MAKLINFCIAIIVIVLGHHCLARPCNLQDVEAINKVVKNKVNPKKTISAALYMIKGTNDYPVIPKAHKKDVEILFDFFTDLSKKTPLGDFMLGYLYEITQNTKQDANKSLYYYNKAADRESSDAIYLLALKKQAAITNHLLFNKISIAQATQEYKEAIGLFLKAADLGHDYAQIMVATMYINGELEYKNYKMAEKYIKKAIQENKPDGYAALGAMYRDMKKFKQSEKYLKLATKQGSAIAPIILFEKYSCGVGADKNSKLAEDYKNIAINNSISTDTIIKNIDTIFTDKCQNNYAFDRVDALSYTSKDVVNDYFSKNRYRIGIIPSVLTSFIK